MNKKSISAKRMIAKRKLLMAELIDLGIKIRKLQSQYEKKIKEIHKIEDKI